MSAPSSQPPSVRSAPARRLGSGGPWVSALGMGCMGMSATYGTADDATSVQTLHAAVDAGVTHFDTPDLYGRGHNERLLRRALSARREGLLLATKFGYRFTDPSTTATRFVDSTGAWAREACEASLRRLGTDAIDLYYLHRRDPGTPIEDTVSAMGELVAAGKVRWLGLSEVSAETLRHAHAVHQIAAVQIEYSLFTRFVEDEMLATCRELGVALVAWAPVGRGWLTGAIHARAQLESGDTRLAHPRFAEPAFARNQRLVRALEAVAAEIDATPAQAALAWLLAQGQDIIPIPGTRRISHLHENLASIHLQLSPEQISRLAKTVPAHEVAGDRHSQANLRTLGH